MKKKPKKKPEKHCSCCLKIQEAVKQRRLEYEALINKPCPYCNKTGHFSYGCVDFPG